MLLRPAQPEDLPALAELWRDSLRAADAHATLRDLETVLLDTAADDRVRVLVAEYDHEFAGAVLLQLDTVSPLNLTPMVRVVAPTVLEPYRRRGVGRALIEAGVAFAEEYDVTQISTASASSSRDANRFMARLGLATRASLRVASTATVRARINAMRPTMGRSQRQQLGHVLAARRSMRRQTPSRAS